MTLIQSRAADMAPRFDRISHPAPISLVAWLALILMAFAALGGIVRNPASALVKSDFAAFYCGAVVTANLRDPYALGPLRACEAAEVDLPGGAEPSAVGVDPAPLPGYAIALFMPFTLLPFAAAALVWDALLIAAIAGTCLLLAELTSLPVIVIAALLAFIDGVASIPYGQTAPLATFGIVLAAYGVVREQLGWIVAGAALSLVVPQIGIPACGAIFVWRPAIRPAILAVVAVLAAISLLVLGYALNVEYLHSVVPAHAFAEGTASTQYSLTWLLHYLGYADATALRWATIQYAVFALAGIALAAAFERKLQTGAALVLFPPALALIGGSFVHLQYIAAAVPFALLLAARSRGWFAWLAILLLVIPWPAQPGFVTFGAMAVIMMIVLAAFPARSRGKAFGVAAAAVIAYAALAGPVMNYVIPAAPRHVVSALPPQPRTIDGDRLASEQDGRDIRANPSLAVATPRTLASRVPVWLALIVIILYGFGMRPVMRPWQHLRV